MVLGTVRALNRLECVGETLRHTLNVLAVTVPEWLLAHSDAEWADRYGPRVDDYRLPKSQAARIAYAEQIGQDGRTLLDAIEQSWDHVWLQEIPAVQTLIRVWQQNYHFQQDHLRWRTSQELPKAAHFVSSPYDRYSPSKLLIIQKRGN